MNLKEAVLQRDNVHYVNLYIDEIRDYISCNVADSNGKYMYENPELSIDDLEGIEFNDVTDFDFSKCDCAFNGYLVTLNEETIKKHTDENKAYKELNKLLIKKYTKYVEMYKRSEKFSLEDWILYPSAIIPFDAFVAFEVLDALQNTQSNQRILILGGLAVLCIAFHIFIVGYYLTDRDVHKICKEYREEYENKLKQTLG